MGSRCIMGKERLRGERKRNLGSEGKTERLSDEMGRSGSRLRRRKWG